MNYYFDNDNNYYKIKKTFTDKKPDYIKITLSEFLEKTKYTKNQLLKLKNSFYPEQQNRYILAKIPDFFRNIKNKYFRIDEKYKHIPIDYKLTNLIKFLWKHKIITGGWDETNNNFFITVLHKTADNKNTIKLLYDLLGLDLFNKLKITIKKDFITIEFDLVNLKLISSKLNLLIPKKNESLEGSLFYYK